MPQLEVVVQIRLGGTELPISPLIRTLQLDETQLALQYERIAHGNSTTFDAIPAAEIATLQALLVSTDKLVTVRLDGQSNAGITLNPGGFLLVVNGLIDAGAGSANASVNNPSTTDVAMLSVVGGGT